MGDLKLRFQTAISVEATDNVNYSEKNQQADISVRPEFDVTAMFPVTDRNTAPMMTSASDGREASNCRLYSGLTAASTAG